MSNLCNLVTYLPPFPGVARPRVAWTRQAMVPWTVWLDHSVRLNLIVGAVSAKLDSDSDDASVSAEVVESRRRSVSVNGYCPLCPVL